MISREEIMEKCKNQFGESFKEENFIYDFTFDYYYIDVDGKRYNACAVQHKGCGENIFKCND